VTKLEDIAILLIRTGNKTRISNVEYCYLKYVDTYYHKF